MVRRRTILILYGDRGEEDVTPHDTKDIVLLLPLVAAALERLIRQKKQTGQRVAPVEPPPLPHGSRVRRHPARRLRHLRARLRHLRASPRHLRASPRHLRASPRHLRASLRHLPSPTRPLRGPRRTEAQRPLSVDAVRPARIISLAPVPPPKAATPAPTPLPSARNDAGPLEYRLLRPTPSPPQPLPSANRA